MDIILQKKEKKQLGGFTSVVFNENIKQSRFVVKDGLKILEIAISKSKELFWRQVFLLPRKIILEARKHQIKKIVFQWKEMQKLNLGDELNVAEIFATNLEMANYQFVTYKTTPKEGWDNIESVIIISENVNQIAGNIKRGQLIGQEINKTRELANMPGGEMTPDILVRETKKAILGTGLKLKVIGDLEMKKIGMNSILTVAKGSKEKPHFIILEHVGKAKNQQPIVLIGKGVTFDSGGLSLKPSDSMADMNMDMSGGAAVIHTLVLAAKLGIKQRVIGLVPAVESMPSGESLRPGDIIKSMSGKTIEVQNTDAEGRIILADANTYAERFNPRLVVNIATLTGAAVVALGERASAIFSKSRELTSFFETLGEQSGDFVWPLPLWDEYEDEIKGQAGDICNLRNRASTRDGGSILGAMFIYQFAKKFPQWIHIDIAPRMTAAHDEQLARGAAGAPVRLLIQLLEKY